MAKKAIRKRKDKKCMPPLSVLDKLIYFILFVLYIVLVVGIILLVFYLRNRIAFAVPGVLATNDTAGMFWALIPILVLSVLGMVWGESWYLGRKPIFGRRGIEYGPPKYPAVYPVFMKNKPSVWISEARKRDRRIGAIALLILIVVSILPFPLSLYSRDSLQTDGSIVEYGTFNQVTELHTVESVTGIEFSLRTDSSLRTARGTWRRVLDTVAVKEYSVCVIITTDDGEQFVYTSADFLAWGKDEHNTWLVDMLHLKALFPPKLVTCKDTEKLNYAAAGYNLSEQETQQLYALFSVEEYENPMG